MRSRMDYVAWLRARAAAYRSRANAYAEMDIYIRKNSNTLTSIDLADMDMCHQLIWQCIDMAAALEEAAAALEGRRAPDDIGTAYGGQGGLLGVRHGA